MFGARFSSGYEFAVGPNLSLGGAGLVLGFGKTIQAGNINIPINFAWVPSTSRQNTSSNFDFENGDYIEEIETVRTGNRFTLTIGFNFIDKIMKKIFFILLVLPLFSNAQIYKFNNVFSDS